VALLEYEKDRGFVFDMALLYPIEDHQLASRRCYFRVDPTLLYKILHMSALTL